jgi:hypothetical protein
MRQSFVNIIHCPIYILKVTLLRNYFNILCPKATEETTRQSSSASLSRGSQTTESTTLKPTHSTMQFSKDNVNGDNPIISLFKNLLLKLI